MADKPTSDDIQVDKTKFDALLQKIARTPALKPEERKSSVKPVIKRRWRKKPEKSG